MVKKSEANLLQELAESEVQKFRLKLGPFVVAADDTRMPMIFTNAKSELNEIVYANQSFLQTMRYERAELLGQPFRSIIAAEGSSKPFILNKAIVHERESHEIKCVRKDGSKFDAALLVSPVVGEKGDLEQFFVSVVDLTKHFDQRKEEHARFSDLYRNAPGFIALTSGPDHRFTYANPAYERLVGRHNLRGQTVADSLPEILSQGFLDVLDRVYETGEHFIGRRLPITLKRAHGSEVRYLDFVYQPVRDESGQVTGLFCEGADVTELQASSHELEAVQAQLVHLARQSAMGTMAATLAHELNQPLAAILNYAAGCTNLLAEEGDGTGPLYEGLEGIVLASNRAGDIIRRLRSMTKRVALQTEAFDVGQALEEAVQLIRAGGCEGVSIEIKQPITGRIEGDRIQVQQVMINLLKNACEAAREGAHEQIITAGSSKKGGKVSLYVQDSGPGISKDAQATLFQWADSSKTDGMGIGLSISRTIIERHNGTISLDRTGSTGTRFSFTLPEAVAGMSARTNHSFNASQ